MKTSVLILGAGAGGLSAAFTLLNHQKNVLVIEKEKFAGGLMRPVLHENFTLDFGFKQLYNRIPVVHQFWQNLLGENLISYKHRTGILFDKNIFEKEIKYKGLSRGIPPRLLVSCLKDLFSHRKIYRHKPIVSLEDFVFSRRGKLLTQIFSQNFDERFKGRKWSEVLISDVFPSESEQENLKAENTLKFIRQFFKKVYQFNKPSPIHFHPLKGSGQIISELESRIKKLNGSIHLGCSVTKINHENNKINSVEVELNKRVIKIEPETVISSLPLESLARLLSINFSPSPKELSFNRSVILVYLFLKEKVKFPHTVLEVASPKSRMGRITNYSQFGGSMVPEGKGCICVEYFCSADDALHSFPEQTLIDLTIDECETSGLIKKENCEGHKVLYNRAADPASSWEDYKTDQTRNKLYKTIEDFSNLFQINRTGIDKSTYAGMIAANSIIEKNKNQFHLLTQPAISCYGETI